MDDERVLGQIRTGVSLWPCADQVVQQTLVLNGVKGFTASKAENTAEQLRMKWWGGGAVIDALPGRYPAEKQFIRWDRMATMDKHPQS